MSFLDKFVYTYTNARAIQQFNFSLSPELLIIIFWTGKPCSYGRTKIGDRGRSDCYGQPWIVRVWVVSGAFHGGAWTRKFGHDPSIRISELPTASPGSWWAAEEMRGRASDVVNNDSWPGPNGRQAVPGPLIINAAKRRGTLLIYP